MPPAPGILTASTSAEMVELYWMALLRDVPLCELNDSPLVAEAVEDLNKAYLQALNEDYATPGGIKTGLDLPRNASGQLDIRAETLFGCGLPGEDQGPRISQFFLQDIPYGVQSIDPRQYPYVADQDYLTEFKDWLCAQNTGTDRFGRGYGSCNYYGDQLAGHVTYYAEQKRFISTMRDMARFVNRDALHQSYFNAALLLDALGAPLDAGNPYVGPNARYDRAGAFATLGGPDLLTLVSEVASRALKVVWRQKWLVHRRCRPEAYGGLLHVQEIGNAAGRTKDFGIDGAITGSASATRVRDQFGGYLLPMAFSAGSPTHPAYGAGHATVAGACVTVLKAWFDEGAKFNADIFPNAPQKDPGDRRQLWQPGCRVSDKDRELFHPPQPYTDGDLTVGGELNKLGSNVAMGRSMGGVHWRSDNTRSLRLGEQIAIEILRKRTHEYAEAGSCFSFTSFDGDLITI